MPETTRLAQTIQTWWPAILIALTEDVTNARTEGFNRIIKQTKRVGCGYRNLANYQRRISRILPRHPGTEVVRVPKDSEARNPRNDLLEHFDVLACEIVYLGGDAGDVAAGVREARDEPGALRIGHHRHHDGHTARRLFGCAACGARRNDEDVSAPLQKFSCKSGQPLHLAF